MSIIRTSSGARFLLWMDMEGVSQIADYRETLPVYSEYWRAGRTKFTADAIAAASGMLKEGAKEVIVIDGHGLEWPNLLEKELPKNTRPFTSGDRFKDFDGLLMVGFHSRCGTSDGFMSHTFVPHFRMAINESLATESHAWAMRAGIPVLGIIGDSVLGTQLDGLLEGTPFLAVKKSSTRTTTAPLYGPQETSQIINDFATKCAREVPHRKVPELHSPITVAFSMPPELAKSVDGEAGLTRTSRSVLTIRAENWLREVDSALDTAMGAAVAPTLTAIEGLNFSTERVAMRAGSETLEKARRFFTDWVRDNYPSWGN